MLDSLNYEVHYKVLNASEFGLPQNRQRIFIVCFRKDLIKKSFHFPIPSQEKVSLFEVLEDNPPDAKIINRPDIVFTKTYQPVKNGGQIVLPNKPIQIGKVNKGGQGERIYSPYGHAITLSAYGGGAGAKTGLYHVNGQIRKLSPRECARVQGFPDSFKVNPSITQAYKQFGNSVAVNVVSAIIKQIYQTGCFDT